MIIKKNLNEQITEELGKRTIQKIEIPAYITSNLRHDFFDWQKSALQYFLAYNQKENGFLKSPTHLMFNMATGTGKTLLMAATILYYYKQGYKNFLFFVNQNNIVDKTENNFIDSTHNKYLFTEKIIIDDATVPIEKVQTFSNYPQGIEIKFTSIQKLYNDIHLERENQTTLDDLQSRDIVMLADEAHHLNANTKNTAIQGELFGRELTEAKLKGSKNEKERKGWEHTVIDLILNKNKSQRKTQNYANKNVLLEFTATILANRQVAQKYEDKIIYQFGLKEFLRAGYTKEINLISSTLEKKERILQALLFQWYRHTIALKHTIGNFKPVVLFRSKTIEESKADYAGFLGWMDNVSSDDLNFIKTISNKIHQAEKPTLIEMGKSRTEQVLQYIQENNIHYSHIAQWIQQNFQEKNTIITNSKTNKTKTEKTEEETEKLLNSLEDKNNHIRAIFTVDRLTEGWDVLNLFDIVRLYQGQNAGGSNIKTPEATTKEKQLIGRGVRYFPFAYQDKIKNKRKFDEDLDNELRVLEELYYYTYDEDSRYISHLKAELKKDGYIRDDRTMKTFALKEDFKETDFYENTKIWYNQKIDNPERQKKTLKDIKKNVPFEYRIKGLELEEQEVDFEKQQDLQKLNLKQQTTKTISKKFKDIEKHIFQKAINIKAKHERSLFQFENLQKELAIETIADLRTDNFLGNVEMRIIAPKNMSYDDINHKEKLEASLKFLDAAFNQLKEHINPKIGSDFRAGNFKKFFAEPKTKSIEEKNLDDGIANNNKWYVLDGFVGTSEEKALVEFIKNSIGNLERKYDEIYLLRNEEAYKMYDFEKGRGFAPDFLLFLKSKETKSIYYQIFIEPKGDQYKDSSKGFKNSKEGWKEEFLEQVTKKHGFDEVVKAENPNYRLIGLPFFNQGSKGEFTKEFKKLYRKDLKNDF